jgi:hypothetical protein
VVTAALKFHLRRRETVAGVAWASVGLARGAGHRGHGSRRAAPGLAAWLHGAFAGIGAGCVLARGRPGSPGVRRLAFGAAGRLQGLRRCAWKSEEGERRRERVGGDWEREPGAAALGQGDRGRPAGLLGLMGQMLG